MIARIALTAIPGLLAMLAGPALLACLGPDEFHHPRSTGSGRDSVPGDSDDIGDGPGSADSADSDDGASDPQAGQCGPRRAMVERVVDGDTIDLATGERVRYLLVDTPELHDPENAGVPECFASEARRFNQDLVLGREIELRYDVPCRDRYDRLLAYVGLVATGENPIELNTRLIERGHARVLYIPPGGTERRDAFLALEEHARAARRGLWGVCNDASLANARLHSSSRIAGQVAGRITR